MGKLKLNIIPSDEEMEKHEQKVKRKELSIIEGIHHKKKMRLTMREEKVYDAKTIAKTYLKVGLTRDMELASSEILMTRNGLNKDKVNEVMLKEAREIVTRKVKQFLKELED